MTNTEILQALVNLQIEKLSTEAAKAEFLYREAVARLRDNKLSSRGRKSKKKENECWLEAQNEMALKVSSELINFLHCGEYGQTPAFVPDKHLDDRFYPVAYTVAAVLYVNGIRG
jgi:uncharacterized membrane protein YdbT with pleckstrin-like domain